MSPERFSPEQEPDAPGEPEPKSGLSRRGFLKGLGGFLTASAFESNAEAARDPLRNIVKRRYPTEALEGRKLADLYSAYTGISGRAPQVAEIDFPHQMASMWERKIGVSKGNPVVLKTSKELVKEYAEKAPVSETLEKYSAQIQKVIRETIEHMDWDKLGKIKGLAPHELILAKKLCMSVNSRHLLAYSLTELMPSTDGKLNINVVKFLLKNAGREYIESIPALYDPKTSFGPYQFTEYALFNTGEEKRGASVSNQALRKGNIPGSVSKLRGNDHHKAAYLFMIDNFCNLVNKMNPKQFEVLNKVWNKRENDLVAYAATAHHGPGEALRIARRWLDNGAIKPFRQSAGRVYAMYAHKTEENFEALKKTANL